MAISRWSPLYTSLIVLFISSCSLYASGREHSNLIGGRDAFRGEFPYAVCVGGYGRCGGTLISLDVVLSVAHCFLKNGEFLHPNSFTVLGGIINIREEFGEEQQSYVREYIVHENFDILKNNEFGLDTIFDVAVAYLESPFAQTPMVKCAVFPASTSLGMLHALKFIEIMGDPCVSVGFGLLAKSDTNTVVSNTLRVFNLRLLPTQECTVDPIKQEYEICATSITEPDKIVPGYSGSTFMCGGYIIGMSKSVKTYQTNSKNITVLVFTLIGPYIDYFDLNLFTDDAANSQLQPVISFLFALQFLNMVRLFFV